MQHFNNQQACSRDAIPATAKDLQTVCVLCSHNCGVRVDVEGGEITAVRPDKDNAITHGYICNKSVTIPLYARHSQRVTVPLKRQEDGSFTELSWGQAIAEIAQKLGHIRDCYSPKALGLVGVGGQANHLDGPFALRLLAALGSRRFFSSWAQEKHQHSLISHWMFDSPPTMFVHPDLEHTRFHMLIGTNPKISNRAHKPNETYRDFAKDPERTLVVVDPRQTESSKQADKHVQLKPGTDVWFLLGMIAHIVQTPGLADRSFIDVRVRGWQDFRDEFAALDVGEMARRCGLDQAQIVWVAEGYARAESASLLHDLGCEQTPFSTVIAYLLQVLAVITGNIGRDGGSVFCGTMKPAVLHPKRFAEPERSIASGVRAIASQGGLGMFSPTLVPEDILVDHPDRLRALIVEGANPWLSYSDTNLWRKAHSELDLLVVIEPAMTESALEADYVLPVPTGYEKWEWSDFVKGYPSIQTQIRKPVLPLQGDALPEPEIHIRLMEALGLVPEPSAQLQALAADALTPDGAKAFMARVKQESSKNAAAELAWTYRLVGPQLPAPGLVAVWQLCFANAQTRRAEVLAVLGDAWADKDAFELGCELWRRIEVQPQSVEVARLNRSTNLDDNLGWEDRKIRLLPSGIVDELRRAVRTDSLANDNYPFTLSAGLRTRWTANTIQREPTWRKGRGSKCSLHMAPEDLRGLGLAEGDIAKVSTTVGEVCLPVEADKGIQRGHAWIPNGYGMWKPGTDPADRDLDGVNINELSDARDRDPISGCPHHKTTLCRIEAA